MIQTIRTEWNHFPEAFQKVIKILRFKCILHEVVYDMKVSSFQIDSKGSPVPTDGIPSVVLPDELSKDNSPLMNLKVFVHFV